MTFVPKTFTNGDVLPAASLNDMDNNDDHVREEAAYRYIWQVLSIVYEKLTGTIGVRLYIDGSAVGTNYTTSGDKSDPDLNVASLSTGLHVLTIVSSSVVLAETRFLKTPDLSYLTCWMSIESAVFDGISTYTHEIKNLTVIGHREAKSWT